MQIPIAQREMLVIAKSAALYRGRISNSILLLLGGIVFSIVYHYAGLRAVSPIIQGVAGVMVIVCLFIGAQLTADAISHEKREGTLGLLFLTPLTPFQIVMGKLITHSLSGLYWLLIAVPLLSLFMIVGGIRGRDLILIALAMMNTLFFSATIGLYASTHHTERKKAAASATWILFFFWLLLPALASFSDYFQLPLWIGKGLRLLAVNGGFQFNTGPRPPSLDSPWLSLLITHVMGWLFVWWATVSLRRNWQDQPAKARFNLREWWKNLSLGKPAARLRLRQKLLDPNPFLWLACRDRLRTLPMWILTGIFLTIMGINTYFLGAPGASIMLGFTLGLGLMHRGGTAGLAAQQIQAEHEQGTLEMLISTPLRVEDIIRGQLLAIRRQFGSLVILVLLLHVLGAIMFFSWMDNPSVRFPAAIAVALHAASYLLDLYAISWVGMWSATQVREARNAAGAAMARILAIPILIFLCIMVGGGAIVTYFGLPIQPSPMGIVLLWFGLTTTNTLFWLWTAKRKLPEALSTFALKRFTPDEQPSSILAKLGRLAGKYWGQRNRGKAPPVIHPVS